MPATSDAARLLSAGASAAETAAALLPFGPGRDAARFLAAALKLGADLAAAGHDPVVAIERLHAAEPLLAGVQARWRARLVARRGPR